MHMGGGKETGPTAHSPAPRPVLSQFCMPSHLRLDARLKKATQHYHIWAGRSKIKSVVKKITPSWVQLPYPRISQQHAKGAALRAMVPWIHEVCSRKTATLHDRIRLRLFDEFLAAEEIMKKEGRYLSPAAAAALAEHVERGLLCYNWLAVQTADKFLWKIIPKHHALVHLAFDPHGMNPRATSCYLDEDFIGKCKKIYKAAHGATAGRTGLLRYIILAGVRWHRRLQEMRGLRRPTPAPAGVAAPAPAGAAPPAPAGAGRPAAKRQRHERSGRAG